MTTFSRFAFASLALLTLTVAALGSHASRAASLYTVSITPVQATAAVGSDAAFNVRVETSTALLPGLQYDVDGGRITGVIAPNAVTDGVAEGTVHVTREIRGHGPPHRQLRRPGARFRGPEVRPDGRRRRLGCDGCHD